MKKLQRIIIFFSLVGIHVQIMPMTSKPNYKLLYGPLDRNFPEYTTVNIIPGVEDPYASHPLKKFQAAMEAKNAQIEDAKNAFIEADQKILDSLGELMGIDATIEAKNEEIATLRKKMTGLAEKMAKGETLSGEMGQTIGDLRQAETNLEDLQKKQANKATQEKTLAASRTKLHQDIDKKMAGLETEIRKLITDNPEEAKFLREKNECIAYSDDLPPVKKEAKAGQVQEVAKRIDKAYKDYARDKSVIFLTNYVDLLPSTIADATKITLFAAFQSEPVITKSEIYSAMNKIATVPKGKFDQAPVMWPSMEKFEKWEALVAKQVETIATGKQAPEEQKGAKPGVNPNQMRLKTFKDNIRKLATADLTKEKLAQVIKVFPDTVVDKDKEYLATLNPEEKAEILGKATIADLKERMTKSGIKNKYLEDLLKALEE